MCLIWQNNQYLFGNEEQAMKNKHINNPGEEMEDAECWNWRDLQQIRMEENKTSKSSNVSGGN